MTDVTSLVDNYALYVPAVQSWFAEFVEVAPKRPGLNIAPCDLNFLRPDAIWTYRYCLASAVLLLDCKRNAITHRKPKTSWVLGDSGGYQIGTGTVLKGFDTNDPDEAAARWRRSSYPEDLLRWLELNCDCAMTLDMPLWLKLSAGRRSAFHNCSVELLTDLTVENLKFFADNRGQYGHCDFLNVLHGRTDEEEEYWFSRVRDFDFEGWAIGGSVGSVLDLQRFLRRLLLLRDEALRVGSSASISWE